jgi:uncharacterized membrane protein
MPWTNYQKAPDLKDKLISGFSYLSLGMIGLVYTLFTGGKDNSPFFRFHFYQSILLGIFWMMIGWTGSALLQVLSGLLGMVPGAPGSVLGWLGLAFQILQSGLLLVMLYGAVFAFIGKMADVPGISKIARNQMR